MNKDNLLEQSKAIVKKVDDRYLWVSIEQKSACTGCHAKSFCVSTDCRDRDMVLDKPAGENYEVGKEIAIYAKESVGIKATIIAFVLPLILIILESIVGDYYDIDSPILALIIFATMVLYFIVVYLFRGLIKKNLRLYPHKIVK